MFSVQGQTMIFPRAGRQISGLPPWSSAKSKIRGQYIGFRIAVYS